MTLFGQYDFVLRWSVVFLSFVCLPAIAATPLPPEHLQALNSYPHAKQIAFSQSQVIDHEIGLGAIQKVRGDWRFKHSERFTGTLLSYTWQIVDGFTSMEVMDNLVEAMTAEGDARELFACNGRACGPGVQWANRVFGQRELYGREDSQRYRVYELNGDTSYLLVVYSAARTTDRQYLRVDLLQITE